MLSHRLKSGTGCLGCKSDFPIPHSITSQQLLTQPWLPSLTILGEAVPAMGSTAATEILVKVMTSKCEGRLVFLPRLGQSSKLI